MVLRPYVATFLLLASVRGYAADSRLTDLVDGANYSDKDKETLKTGLAVALPGAATEYVSQETIDTQVKKAQGDFATTYAFVSSVAQCLEDKKAEFLKSEAFRRVERAKRSEVTAYLGDVIEQYRARAFETLLARHDRSVSVPANVPRSVNNADYRELLAVAVRAALLGTPKKSVEPQVAAKPAVVEKPVVVEKQVAETVPPAEAKPAVVETPAVVEKTVETEKPVVVEKTVQVEKPVVVEQPAVVEKTVEKTIEKTVEKTVETVVEKPAVVEKAAETPSVEKGAESPVAVEKVVETPAVEKVGEQPAVVETAPEKPVIPGKQYTIVEGDSLALLGRLNKVSPAAIVEANPGLEATRMSLGQVITIPLSDSTSAAANEYTLAVGDSLALLGRLNKIPPAAIVEANPGLHPNRMHVGQIITIPSSDSIGAATNAAPTTKQAPFLTSK